MRIRKFPRPLAHIDDKSSGSRRKEGNKNSESTKNPSTCVIVMVQNTSRKNENTNSDKNIFLTLLTKTDDDINATPVLPSPIFPFFPLPTKITIEVRFKGRLNI